MPNKHDKSKIQTGFWVDKELLFEAKAILAKNGTTLTDEFLKMLKRVVEREKLLIERKRDAK